MQSLVFILFFISLSAFAKTDWCNFDSEFSQKYLEARHKYAERLKRTKPNWKSTEEYNFGHARKKLHGNTWEPISMRDQIQRQFGTTEVEYVVKENGKMLIYPKGMKVAKPAIIFDPSGDYFRVVATKINRGIVEDTNFYFDKMGKAVQRPKGMPFKEWRSYLQAKTHFNAVP